MKSQTLLAVVIAGFLAAAFPVRGNGAIMTTPRAGSAYPMTTVDWGYNPPVSLSIPKFDPTLGNLISVMYGITGTLKGYVEFENLDAGLPQTVAYQLSAELTVPRPDNPITTFTAVISNAWSELIPAFDGQFIPGHIVHGGSGRVYSDLAVTGEDNVVVTGTGVNAFIGPGDIILAATAHGTSHVSAGSMFYGLVLTQAGAQVWVEYTYGEVPEPSTLVISLGMIASWGVAAVWRRRKTARKSAP